MKRKFLKLNPSLLSHADKIIHGKKYSLKIKGKNSTPIISLNYDPVKLSPLETNVDFCGELLNEGDYMGLRDIFREVYQRPEDEYIGLGPMGPGPIGIKDGRVFKVRIYNSQLTKLPDSVAYWSEIQELNLGYNYLRTVINQLGELKKLRILDLTHNLIPKNEIELLNQCLPNTRICSDKQIV